MQKNDLKKLVESASIDSGLKAAVLLLLDQETSTAPGDNSTDRSKILIKNHFVNEPNNPNEEQGDTVLMHSSATSIGFYHVTGATENPYQYMGGFFAGN